MPEIKNIRPMDPNDARIARTMLRLRETDDLPESFLKMYWTFKNVGDRISLHVTPERLLMICILSGCDSSPPPPPTVFDLWRDHKIEKYRPVAYKLGEAVRLGKLEDVAMDFRKVYVRDDKTSHVYELDAPAVNLHPDLADFAEA